jgi:hypothetical protein
MITPHQAFEIIVGRRLVNPTVEMLEFIQHAPARSLQEFILLSRNAGTEAAFNMDWVRQAEISILLRIGEDNIAAANTIVKQLTEQTELLVTESRKLTTLTEKLSIQNTVLVKESTKLGRLTVALVWLTLVLAALTAGLLCIDWHRG